MAVKGKHLDFIGLGLIFQFWGDIWNISKGGGGGGEYVNFWISRMSRGWICGGFWSKSVKLKGYVRFFQLSEEFAAQSAF